MKGQITEVQKTLTSEEKYPGTNSPAAFVSGNFTRNDSLQAEITEASENTVEYRVTINSYRAENAQSLRLYIPFEEYELFGVDEGGNEHQLESGKRGSYAEYRGALDHEIFRIKEKEKNFVGRIKSFFGS